MAREKLKVAVLYDVFEEEPEPPPPPPEKPAKSKSRAPRKKKKEKHDREEIFEALQKLGHEAVYQVVDGRDQSLIALARSEADGGVSRWTRAATEDPALGESLARADAEQRRLRPELDVGIAGTRTPGYGRYRPGFHRRRRSAPGRQEMRSAISGYGTPDFSVR